MVLIMFIHRRVNLPTLVSKKSLFFFGPRQTGKSSLIAQSLPSETPLFNLLDHELFLELSANPSLMRQRLKSLKGAGGSLVVIDEIQKLPVLLDEVQLLIETHGYRFIMTGSSARKLRRGGTNLLGGRARELRLHPLTYGELGENHFDLIKALNRGLIPSVYFSDNPRADLRSYAGSYLDQEIASEASVRNIESFSRFLLVAAMCNGQITNHTTIGSDAKVARKTVAEYFEILRDTLIGHELPAWTKSKKRKATGTSKFYFFDVGVARSICDLPPVKEKSPDFGETFEHFIFHELRTYIDYEEAGLPLAYWRSTSGFEVDFILADEVAVEVKGKSQIGDRDLRGLRALAEERCLNRYIVVSMEDHSRITEDGIEILPWRDFLNLLWTGKLIKKREAI